MAARWHTSGQTVSHQFVAVAAGGASRLPHRTLVGWLWVGSVPRARSARDVVGRKADQWQCRRQR